MSEPQLDHFGQVLMKNVRDQAIDEWEMIIAGKMKSASSQRAHAALANLDAEQVSAVRALVPQIVDSTLHHLLWTLDQDKSIVVGIRTPSGLAPDISNLSDGLPGELYGKSGWINRFSNKPAPEM